MIFNFLINLVLLIIGATLDVFHLDPVTTLPTIGGFNIDAALVSGMAELKTFMVSFWPVQDMFYGFLALAGYFALKMLLAFVLGSRAPGRHA